MNKKYLPLVFVGMFVPIFLWYSKEHELNSLSNSITCGVKVRSEMKLREVKLDECHSNNECENVVSREFDDKIKEVRRSCHE